VLSTLLRALKGAQAPLDLAKHHFFTILYRWTSAVRALERLLCQDHPKDTTIVFASQAHVAGLQSNVSMKLLKSVVDHQLLDAFELILRQAPTSALRVVEHKAGRVVTERIKVRKDEIGCVALLESNRLVEPFLWWIADLGTKGRPSYNRRWPPSCVRIMNLDRPRLFVSNVVRIEVVQLERLCRSVTHRASRKRCTNLRMYAYDRRVSLMKVESPYENRRRYERTVAAYHQRDGVSLNKHGE
jgi:hypothetical protein